VTNGVRPNHLIQGANGDLYGTTFDDIGVNAVNRVFRLSLTGEFTTLVSGTPQDPSALVQGADGWLYVASAGGGRYGWGNIFKVSSAGAVVMLVEFNETNGSEPSSLLAGTVGNLYGTTQFGGADYSAPTSP